MGFVGRYADVENEVLRERVKRQPEEIRQLKERLKVFDRINEEYPILGEWYRAIIKQDPTICG